MFPKFTLRETDQIEKCRSLALQAITYAGDEKSWRDKRYFLQNVRLTLAYEIRDSFLQYGPAWKLCHKACKESQRQVNAWQDYVIEVGIEANSRK